MLIPETQPVFRGLSSYYIDVTKLLEHVRLSNATGCIRFSSSDTNGVVFYSKNKIINQFFSAAGKKYFGNDAISALVKIAELRKCKIDIYNIEEKQILFWANLSKAQTLYDNLTTDLTDLGKLVRKVETEKNNRNHRSLDQEWHQTRSYAFVSRLARRYPPAVGGRAAHERRLGR